MGGLMKSKLVCICVLLIVFNMVFSADAASLQVSAKSAVLICADTGQIIYEHNAQEKLSMASTTKIMTALLAIENLSPQAEISIGNEVLNVDGTSLGLKPGDRIRVYDLLVGLMLSSGNDAANAVAVAVSGSMGAFADLMNRRAVQIGMQGTSFVTPSGLDDENHYSTAYDMALLTREALQNEVFADIVSKYTATIHIGSKKIWLKNHNRLLQSYNGLIGVKTGFTKKSGRCLVTAAERDGVRLIAVTLKAPDDWNDHRALLDYGFSEVKRFSVCEYMPQYYVDVVGGKSNSVACVPAAEMVYSALQPLTELQLQVTTVPFVYAPVQKGDILGKITCFYNGIKISEVPLCATDDVEFNALVIQEKTNRQHWLQLLSGWFSYG
ncbi:MAG: D-alanyl-D-alanine carboxypeptidase [Clostridia bacterium]|nr:D-alanyl-D-alanine carboxypeptidase [Clostridia bacterium]